MTDLSPTSRDHAHTNIGRDTVVLSPSGTPLVFRPIEKKFLSELDKTHSFELAAQSIGKPVEWAYDFFNRPKVYEWTSWIAAQTADKNGITVQWCISEALAVWRGYRLWWESECGTCHVKQKSYLEPEGGSKCLACHSPVTFEKLTEPVKKDRQQVVIFQEIMGRVWPKVERVSHEFSNEDFIFKAQED